MAFITKTFTTTCPGDLIGAINTDPAISVICSQIINPQNGTSIFQFATTLTVPQDAALDALLATWVCPIAPPPDTGSQVVNDELPPSTDTLWTSEKTNEEIQIAVANVNVNYIVLDAPEPLMTGNKYLLNVSDTFVLPDTSVLTGGEAVVFAKSQTVTPLIETFDTGTEVIVTDIGTDSAIEYDMTQDIIIAYNGVTWELQFGGQ